MQSFRRALAYAAPAALALAFACALHTSLACPLIQTPRPLRALYRESARVVVARVAASEVVKTEDTMALARITLEVTENVKGEGERAARLYQWVSAGEGSDGEDSEAELVTFSGHVVPPLKPGERFLFFLNPDEEQGDGYQISDTGYGVKKLSDEALKVYLERIAELAEITRREPADQAALVEWLVRCAEEPATRWEGAYELLEGAVETVGDEDAEEGGAAPEAPAGVEASAGAEGQEAAQDFSLAALLDPAQKQRLADALFAAEKLGEGETPLLHVVQDFDDPRFVPFVLGRLRRVEDDPPQEVESWLTALANALKNDEMSELASAYVRDATYYEEEEEEGETEAAEAGAQSQAQPAGRPEAGEAGRAEGPDEPEDLAAAEAREAAAFERAARKRAALLKAALARIDLFISTGEAASN